MRKQRGIFNCAALWDPKGRLLGLVAKSHLLPIKEMPETKIFHPGKPEGKVIDTGLCKIGIMVCFDMRFPELARKLALNGAELIVVPSAWGKKRAEIFKTLSMARAIENQLFLFAVNRAGRDGLNSFAGCTALYDPLGNPVRGASKDGKEALVVSEVDTGKIKKARGFVDCLKVRHHSYGL